MTTLSQAPRLPLSSSSHLRQELQSRDSTYLELSPLAGDVDADSCHQVGLVLEAECGEMEGLRRHEVGRACQIVQIGRPSATPVLVSGTVQNCKISRGVRGGS